MKKIFIVVALFCLPAHAGTMCVALEPTALVGCGGQVGSGDSFAGAVDWTRGCFNDIVKVQVNIKGVGVCASSAESGPLDNLTVSDGNNIYCWCRAISPFVTSWIRGSAPTDECFNLCAHSCSQKNVGVYLENIMTM